LKAHFAASLSETVSRPEDDEPCGPLASDSNESLSGEALVQEVLKTVKNKYAAELMVLELMRQYSFSFTRLKELFNS
jgi:hypothetical protein